MLILLTGATGSIGERLGAALTDAGHKVIGCTRDLNAAWAAFPERFFIEADLNRDLDARAWRPRLYDVDAVINCAGILRETAVNTFEGVHALGPRALFEACRRARINRVIQFSIAGTEARARSHLIASRRYADNFLETLDVDWTVLAAGPVFVPGSRMSKALVALAHLPHAPLIDTRGARMAPIHMDDVGDAVVRLLEPSAPVRTRVPLVGPEAMSLSIYLARLRRACGLREPRSFGLSSLARMGAYAADLAGAGFPAHELLALLRTDLVGDPTLLTGLLGRPPRPVEAFITRNIHGTVSDHPALRRRVPDLHP